MDRAFYIEIFDGNIVLSISIYITMHCKYFYLKALKQQQHKGSLHGFVLGSFGLLGLDDFGFGNA